MQTDTETKFYFVSSGHAQPTVYHRDPTCYVYKRSMKQGEFYTQDPGAGQPIDYTRKSGVEVHLTACMLCGG